MALEEHEIIIYVTKYLLTTERAIIESIAIKEHKNRNLLINELKKSGINGGIIHDIKFDPKKEDIVAYYTFNSKRKQRKMIFEAKGDSKFYAFYTSLGQFICGKNSPSTYYWFGFAFPFSWRKQIKNKLTDKGKINPIIDLLIKNYTKNGQGLWFYFVKENGEVKKETWRQTLTGK